MKTNLTTNFDPSGSPFAIPPPPKNSLQPTPFERVPVREVRQHPVDLPSPYKDGFPLGKKEK